MALPLIVAQLTIAQVASGDTRQHFEGVKSKYATTEFVGRFGAPRQFSKPSAWPTDEDVKASEAAELPESVDWVATGAVTPAKDQGQCGSCWDFSTTGAIEGARFISTGVLTSLSEQQFLACTPFGNCNSEDPYIAMRWAENHSLCTEGSYPYKPPSGKPFPPPPPLVCHADICTVAVPRGAIRGYRFVASHSEEALRAAVARQPISVGVDVAALASYRGGIISGFCSKTVEHAVLVVGYGTEAGRPYWKVKNSYGHKFGEDGYFRVLRNDSACARYKTGGMAILSTPVYPVLG